MNTTYRVVSYGAGVQSTCLVMRCLDGELPMPDAVIFADTGWEPASVYKTLEETRPLIEAAGVQFIVARKGNVREDMVSHMTDAAAIRSATMPFHTRNPLDNSKGMVRRQCTREYKVEAINQAIRSEIIGLKPGQRMPKDVRVEQMIGISTDEAQRMKPNPRPWIDNVWPLCDMPVRGYPLFSRQKCVDWLAKHHPELTVAKSSCIGCPFHSDAHWREMRDNRPDEWEDACQFDEAVRGAVKMRDQVFVHRSGTPLREVDLSTAEDHGQIDMFNNECEGLCGI